MSKTFTRFFLAFASIVMVTAVPGCAVVGGIFKAGVWVGVLGIVFLVAIILWIIRRSSNK
jgi:hypothetical protein